MKNRSIYECRLVGACRTHHCCCAITLLTVGGVGDFFCELRNPTERESSFDTMNGQATFFKAVSAL